MTEQSEPGRTDHGPQDPDEAVRIADAEPDGFQIPVQDRAGPAPGPDRAGDQDPEPPGGPRTPGAAPGAGRASVEPRPGESEDWTRGDSVRDDPGTLGEEVRKLWEVVHNHFVDPVLRNYPEAAGHLGSAGLEVASAFRALLRAGEQRWTGKPPAERDGGAGPDWDGRIVIGEDGGDTDEDTADRPKD